MKWKITSLGHLINDCPICRDTMESTGTDPIIGTAGEDLKKGDDVTINSDGLIYLARNSKTTKIKVVTRPGQPTEWRVPPTT